MSISILWDFPRNSGHQHTNNPWSQTSQARADGKKSAGICLNTLYRYFSECNSISLEGYSFRGIGES